MRKDYYGKIRERVGPYVEGKVDKARNAGQKAYQTIKKGAESASKMSPLWGGTGIGMLNRASESLKNQYQQSNDAVEGLKKGLNGVPRGFQDGTPRKNLPSAEKREAYMKRIKQEANRAQADSEIENSKYRGPSRNVVNKVQGVAEGIVKGASYLAGPSIKMKKPLGKLGQSALKAGTLGGAVGGALKKFR